MPIYPFTENWFYQIIEGVREGITVSDQGGHFEIFNSRMQEITGYSIEEANSGDFSQKLYPEPDARIRALAGVHDVLENGGRHEIETVIQAKNGMRKTLLVSSSLITYKEQKMFLSTYLDITIRREALDQLAIQTAELKKSKENLLVLTQLKSEFISVVSHELRTPLTVINESLDLVYEGIVGPVSPEQKSLLLTGKNNVNRLERLINDILDFQKIETGRIRYNIHENDLNAVIREVHDNLASVAQHKNLKFLLLLDERLPFIRFDRDRIAQVVTNLIDNALKFTESGVILVTSKTLGRTVQVMIQDSGVGINKDDLPQIFDRFLQGDNSRRLGGVGLGLAICREIIEKHNGKIWVESNSGKGARFYFQLPM